MHFGVKKGAPVITGTPLNLYVFPIIAMLKQTCQMTIIYKLIT